MVSFRALYPRGTDFKRITQAIAKISDEATLKAAQEGAVLWAFSPDKTVLGLFKFEPSAFDEYTVDGNIGLNFSASELYKVARRATRNDAVILHYESGFAGLSVELQDKKTSFSRSFTVTAMETSEAEIREIDLRPTARIVMTADDLAVLIADVKTVGDIVELIAKEDSLIVRSSAEEKEYTWTMKAGSPLQEISVESETKASYSAKSLFSSLKPIVGLAESITIEYATDYPLKISISSSGPEQILIYIAPVQG
ncbi:MAG: DNA polymerase sliding clamp [Acidilobus sp.]